MVVQVKARRAPVIGEILLEETHRTDLGRKREILEAITAFLAEKGFIRSKRSETMTSLCLDEGLVNAMLHGNGGDASKRVTIRVMADEERFGISIEDEGSGFAPGDVPDPEAPEFLLQERGRGIILIENFMDEVAYYDGGSILMMIRRKETDE